MTGTLSYFWTSGLRTKSITHRFRTHRTQHTFFTKKAVKLKNCKNVPGFYCQNNLEVLKNDKVRVPKHGAHCTTSSSSRFGTSLEKDHCVFPLHFLVRVSVWTEPCMCFSRRGTCAAPLSDVCKLERRERSDPGYWLSGNEKVVQ